MFWYAAKEILEIHFLAFNKARYTNYQFTNSMQLLFIGTVPFECDAARVTQCFFRTFNPSRHSSMIASRWDSSF